MRRQEGFRPRTDSLSTPLVVLLLAQLWALVFNLEYIFSLIVSGLGAIGGASGAAVGAATVAAIGGIVGVSCRAELYLASEWYWQDDIPV